MHKTTGHVCLGAVLHAKTQVRSLQRLVILVPKVTVLHAQNHRWGLDTYVTCYLRKSTTSQNHILRAGTQVDLFTAVLVPRHLGTRKTLFCIQIWRRSGTHPCGDILAKYSGPDKYWFRRKTQMNALTKVETMSVSDAKSRCLIAYTKHVFFLTGVWTQ